jgi:hypothetical protein
MDHRTNIVSYRGATSRPTKVQIWPIYSPSNSIPPIYHYVPLSMAAHRMATSLRSQWQWHFIQLFYKYRILNLQRLPLWGVLMGHCAGEIALYGPSGYFSFMGCANGPLCRQTSRIWALCLFFLYGVC